MSEFSSRDAKTVRMTYTYGACQDLILVSAYLPHDSGERSPTKELRDVDDYSHSKKKQLIVRCDAKAHHILWGSIGTNPREQSFRQYLVISNLNMLNKGNQSSFVVHNRKQVTDSTLGTNKIGNMASNWRVSDEPSLSDHRYICFQIGNIVTTTVTFRGLKRTNWESY